MIPTTLDKTAKPDPGHWALAEISEENLRRTVGLLDFPRHRVYNRRANAKAE